MSEVKWIKICTDIFDDEKILLIEAMPEAYATITVWFKLLCLAGKQNNSGVLTLNDTIPYTDEMFATIFRMPVNTVRLALNTFEQFGMIETINGAVTIPKWGKYQNLEGIERSNELAKNRMKAYRERQKQKALTEGESTLRNSYVTVTQTDKDIDKEKEIDKDNIYSSVIEYLNLKAGTSYRASTPKTKTLIHARTEEGFTEQDFKTVIDKKCSEWMGTGMEKYLRPETLFGTKFEGYLNAKEKGNDSRSNISSSKQSKASISIVYDN